MGYFEAILLLRRLRYSGYLSCGQQEALRQGCLQLSEADVDGRGEVGAVASTLYRALTPVF